MKDKKREKNKLNKKKANFKVTYLGQSMIGCSF